MSLSLWAYEPDKCDGDVCPNNCYICEKAEITNEHFPVEIALAMLDEAINKREETNERD